ncbi:C40 family peptidase [Pantanalinema sp. GBBB05]|uniref:C40 family peptidase n=1 Tax=Pantanalinema sp. GBBB05 TaxID=2604139 RepID=UPI001D978FA8|nr:NlpC/P60 family protein [Pantanalinema sp. GBBB05]
MVLSAALPTSTQYCCRQPLNLYDSPALDRLATQAAATRHLRIVAPLHRSPEQNPTAIQVCLCEDDYPGWLSVGDLAQLVVAATPYQPQVVTATEIRAQVPQVIAYTQAAMAQPNQYLWGGTIPPNYDCSGLMQAAFASVGIWIPRDAYQQEAFTQAIAWSELQPGDLVFFGSATKATHVGLYLGEDRYIHSSGKDQGHNGIAIDSLADQTTAIGCAYRSQLRGAGRVIAAYQPQTGLTL